MYFDACQTFCQSNGYDYCDAAYFFGFASHYHTACGCNGVGYTANITGWSILGTNQHCASCNDVCPPGTQCCHSVTVGGYYYASKCEASC